MSERDVVAYLSVNYPPEHGLSKTRLMRMVYLADWRGAWTLGRQITHLHWTFGDFGPFSSELIKVLQTPEFEITSTENEYGNPKNLVSFRGDPASIALKPEEALILDFVIEASRLDWKEFTELVYSTFPLLVSSRDAAMDLVKIAQDYQSSQRGRLAKG
jgi:hypothetical protein